MDPEYESYVENDVYKQRLVGYRYRHLMKVEFPSDNDRLGQILSALAAGPVKAELDIGYTVKDPEAAKNELLARAVADAREKAAVLTRAAGVALRELQSVDYSWGEVDFEVRTTSRKLAMNCTDGIINAENCSLDLEPDDITASDTVTLVWEIG